MREMTVVVSKTSNRTPRIAVFSGTKLATSTSLSVRVQRFLNTPEKWEVLPSHTRDWLNQQLELSQMPRHDRLLAETFWRGNTANLCIYGFAGRNAMQTLGLLVTKIMEEKGLGPLGFVSTDYALLIWSVELATDPHQLMNASALRDGFERWLSKNAVMKRTFRNAARVAFLMERNFPGERKSGKQATFSSDILYDTLIKYDPGHLLLEITKAEAEKGLVDFGRIEEMLNRVGNRIDLVHAPHVTPLAAPLFLEVGKVPIHGNGRSILEEREAETLMREAGLAT